MKMSNIKEGELKGFFTLEKGFQVKVPNLTQSVLKDTIRLQD